MPLGISKIAPTSEETHFEKRVCRLRVFAAKIVICCFFASLMLFFEHLTYVSLSEGQTELIWIRGSFLLILGQDNAMVHLSVNCSCVTS